MKQDTVDLTKGSVAKGIISFTIPLILGQLLQQLYNMADAWVIGNFADNAAFAAVSSSGSLVFLIVGFFNGIAVGGGVVISRFFGAGDEENVEKAIHTNVLFGVIASALMTILGLFFAPQILKLMQVPENVLSQSVLYFKIYFAGSSTIVMYNIFMSIMRALGDSLHPLYYLAVSSIVNIVLDILFVAGFHWGVAGAAVATVISQGLSAILCLLRMRKSEGCMRISFRKLVWHSYIMRDVIRQGLPAGIQNSVISIGNVVVQTNVNSFGEYAMSGMGSHTKIEGFVFIPIMAMSLTMSTFISQNLGAKEYDRAKKGAVFGIGSCIVIAEVIGVIAYVFAPEFIRIFAKAEEAIAYGVIQERTVTLFYFLLAFSHSATGVLRGCGKSVIPMVTMLGFWCGIRVLYVTVAIRIFPVFQTVCWAYPITWSLSSMVFLWFLLKTDWVHAYEK
ncbi:MAG: MATE family efflux transporter [Dorea sp.]|jgi:putative MATE family efflux protein|nr:MATE family efflux transporter [Dorea sp.]